LRISPDTGRFGQTRSELSLTAHASAMTNPEGDHVIAIETAAAVLTIVFVALPARGIIGRNGVVGIRTRATMRSDENWILGHRAAIVPTSIAGGATVVVSLVYITLGRADDVPAIVACAAILVGGAFWGVLVAGRATR
jgi:hypothetical protein